MTKNILAVIKGAGEVASGVAYTILQNGIQVVMTEIPKPTTERRTVAFAEAVYSGEVDVEGVTAKKVDSYKAIYEVINEGKIPIVVDPEGKIIKELVPDVVVDGIMAKRNLGTNISDARIVIGLGPGFVAGEDVHAVVETLEGPNLGEVIYEGSTEPDTGVPCNIGGFTSERIIRAPAEGIIKALKGIGDLVEAGEVIATINNKPVRTKISGTLRGLVKNGLYLKEGVKIGDIDPREVRKFSISVRSQVIAYGVLKSIHDLLQRSCREL
jgi:xanthine dehydrogenase accessory factor